MSNNGKFLNLASGQKVLDSGLVASTGAPDAGKIPALDSRGKIDPTLLGPEVSQDTWTIVASEALSAGALINIYSNASTLNMRNADATSAGKEANGYVLAAVASGASGTAFVEEGTVTGLSGLTVGAIYYLSKTTPGGVVLAASLPSSTGNVVQEVGKAKSATELLFRPRQPITIA